MELYAVITGDIVNSRKVSDRDDLLKTLKNILSFITEKYDGMYEIYRGDSFQLISRSPAQSIWMAILIRAALIKNSPNSQEKWDARISIGIGQVSYQNDDIRVSDGEAFHVSGNGLRLLEKTKERLIIRLQPLLTDSTLRAERELSILTRFADNIVSNWSRYSAEAMYYKLSKNEAQAQIAQRLNISQPGIRKRLITAKSELIFEYINHVKEQINWVKKDAS